MNCPVCGTWHETTACNTNHTRHGCGPGAALPADTQTEGARLPRRTREELIEEYDKHLALLELSEPRHYRVVAGVYQRLADLAGQIAEMEE